MFGQLLGQLLGAANRQLGHFVEVGVDHIQPAAEAGQQTQRGFLADAGHARNVIDLVAHQRQVIDDQLRANTKFFFYPFNIHHGVGHGVDQGDVRINQLGHILIAGRDHHGTAMGGTFARQGANHVVRLYAFNTEQRQAQGLDAGVQWLDLYAQIIGHGRAMGFVLLEHGVAEGRSLGIKNHPYGAIRILFAQALEHVEHALDRTRGQAF